jgi:glycosyltransferase involved in cell wall biosynthesis
LKKVLIITYYWPPSGGSGVQRWLRFVKNLRQFGWEPSVYTADNAHYEIIDDSLIREIPDDVQTYKLRVRDANSILAKLSLFTGKKSQTAYDNRRLTDKDTSLKQKFLWFVRGNFFVPDAKMFWIRPSARYLSRILKEKKYDLLVSTGPPHSLHLIAKKLHEQLNIPWVADFRDPWTSIDYIQEINLSRFARAKHERLEREVVCAANKVVVIGRTMYTEFKDKYNVESEIIYNGYNEFHQTQTDYPIDKKFSLVHIGIFSQNRNCNDLWEVLAELIAEDPVFSTDFELKLVGKTDTAIIESIDRFKLRSHLNSVDYVPYDKTQEYLYGAQVLLLPINRVPYSEFILTGKLFEYLKSNRPILLIGPPHGDAAEIIQKCNAGYCINFDDKLALKAQIRKMYIDYKENKNTIQPVDVEQFSGYRLTKRLGEVFDGVV